MKRNKFSLSHYKLLSMTMGELVPLTMMEVLPGDSIQHATSALVRCAPMVAPVMHPVHTRIHHWFVPFRLLWDNWEKFITGGPDGNDASTFPTITMPVSGGAAVGSLADYLGVPTGVNSLEVSALPFRAYALIFNEWYRDQDLVSPLAISTADGPDTTTSTALQNVAWEKDYFTSSRPWEQKGPSITIPIGTTAPVKGIGMWNTSVGTPAAVTQRQTGESGTVNPTSWMIGDSGSLGSGESAFAVEQDPNHVGWPNIRADLTGASAVTVTALRQALALQRYEEARARFGSRYTEYLRFLGVRSSDARLQRPEYLGGGKQTLQFSEVLQTGPDASGDGVANLLGHGIGAMRSNRYRRFIEEHGLIISLMSTKPRTVYAQGLFRTWNRRTKTDFWQKELQHIGQQKVLNKEVYAPHASPDGTFGFQDRYDEYRRMESSIAGEFRTTELDIWHMARIFASDPALNATFVKSVPTTRNFAVEDHDNLYVMAHHSVQARRLVAAKGSSFIF